MILRSMERGSATFAAFESELAAARLPVGDLDSDEARYFSMEGVTDRALAYVGLICCGQDALLRSLVVPMAYRGASYVVLTLKAATVWTRENGAARLWLLTTDADRYIIRQGFRIVPRLDVPAAISNTRQFSSTCPDTAVLMCLKLV